LTGVFLLIRTKGRAPTLADVTLNLSPKARATLEAVNELCALRGTPKYHAAANKFIAANRPLAVRQARRYERRGLEFEDLVAVALMGMAEALARWDSGRARAFSTYAIFWMRQALQKYVREDSLPIRVPEHWHRLDYRVSKSRKALMRELGREPTDVEICAHAEVSEKQLANLRKLTLRDTEATWVRLDHIWEDSCAEKPSGLRKRQLRVSVEASVTAEDESASSPVTKQAIAALEERPALAQELRNLMRNRSVDQAMAKLAKQPHVLAALRSLGGTPTQRGRAAGAHVALVLRRGLVQPAAEAAI